MNNKILNIKTILILTTLLFSFSNLVFAQTNEISKYSKETLAPISVPQINIDVVNGTYKSDQIVNTAIPEEIFPGFIIPETPVNSKGKTKGSATTHPLDCAIPVISEANFIKKFRDRE